MKRLVVIAPRRTPAMESHSDCTDQNQNQNQSRSRTRTRTRIRSRTRPRPGSGFIRLFLRSGIIPFAFRLPWFWILASLPAPSIVLIPIRFDYSYATWRRHISSCLGGRASFFGFFFFNFFFVQLSQISQLFRLSRPAALVESFTVAKV